MTIDDWARRFRGRNPPASLKRNARARPCTSAARFRGRNPPASLKLRGARRGGARPPEVSGGEIPRPH